MKKRLFVPIVLVLLLLAFPISTARDITIYPLDFKDEIADGYNSASLEESNEVIIDTSRMTKKAKNNILTSLASLQVNGDIKDFRESSNTISIDVSENSTAESIVFTRNGATLDRRITSYIIQLESSPIIVKEKELDTEIEKLEAAAQLSPPTSPSVAQKLQEKDLTLSQHESTLRSRGISAQEIERRLG